MSLINQINIHRCEKIRVREVKFVDDTSWIEIYFDDFHVGVFDKTLEDLRGALYRYDMEVYDADSA